MLIGLIPLLVTATASLVLPATRLEAALPQLEAATHLKLGVSRALKNEVIIASFHDVDPMVALDHLADSVDGVWESKPDGSLMLTLDSAKLVAHRRAVYAAQVATFEKALTKLKKEPQASSVELKKSDVDTIRDELKKKLSAEDQSQFDSAQWTDALIAQSEEKDPVLRAATSLGLTGDARFYANLPISSRIVYSTNPTPMQKRFSSAQQQILERYFRESRLFDPTIEFDHCIFTIQKRYSGYALTMFEVLNGTETVRSAGDRLGLQDQQEVIRALTCSSDRQNEVQSFRTNQPNKFEWKFRDPFSYEPLQNGPSSELILSAQSRKANIIGTVGDGQVFDVIVEQRPLILDNEKYATRASDGWFIARKPLDEPYFNRKATTDLFRQAIRQGGLSVDECAQYYKHFCPPNAEVLWPNQYLLSLVPSLGVDEDIPPLSNTPFLAFWSELSVQQRVELSNGESLSFRSIGSSAVTQITRLVYWDELCNTQGDVTDALPNGIGNSHLTLSIDEEAMISFEAKDSDDSRSSMNLSLSDFATNLAAREYRGVATDSGKMRVGILRRYRLDFSLGTNGTPFQLMAVESFCDPHQKSGRDLPPDIAAKLQTLQNAKLKEIQERGTTIPPG
ncbi:hypothetical protein BH11ARM1_BH11ARM1_02600 [soil metagenome]